MEVLQKHFQVNYHRVLSRHNIRVDRNDWVMAYLEYMQENANVRQGVMKKFQNISVDHLQSYVLRENKHDDTKFLINDYTLYLKDARHMQTIASIEDYFIYFSIFMDNKFNEELRTKRIEIESLENVLKLSYDNSVRYLELIDQINEKVDKIITILMRLSNLSLNYYVERQLSNLYHIRDEMNKKRLQVQKVIDSNRVREIDYVNIISSHTYLFDDELDSLSKLLNKMVEIDFEDTLLPQVGRNENGSDELEQKKQNLHEAINDVLDILQSPENPNDDIRTAVEELQKSVDEIGSKQNLFEHKMDTMVTTMKQYAREGQRNEEHANTVDFNAVLNEIRDWRETHPDDDEFKKMSERLNDLETYVEGNEQVHPNYVPVINNHYDEDEYDEDEEITQDKIERRAVQYWLSIPPFIEAVDGLIRDINDKDGARDQLNEQMTMNNQYVEEVQQYQQEIAILPSLNRERKLKALNMLAYNFSILYRFIVYKYLEYNDVNYHKMFPKHVSELDFMKIFMMYETPSIMQRRRLSSSSMQTSSTRKRSYSSYSTDDRLSVSDYDESQNEIDLNQFEGLFDVIGEDKGLLKQVPHENIVEERREIAQNFVAKEIAEYVNERNKELNPPVKPTESHIPEPISVETRFIDDDDEEEGEKKKRRKRSVSASKKKQSKDKENEKEKDKRKGKRGRTRKRISKTDADVGVKDYFQFIQDDDKLDTEIDDSIFQRV